MRSIEAIKAAARRAGDLISPRVCHACQSATGPEGNELCPECWVELSENIGGAYCRRCGEDRGAHLLVEDECAVCGAGQAGGIRFHRFIRVGQYKGVLQRLILQFKHRFILDELLGRLLASAIVGAIDPAEVTYWTPVPSPWRRCLARGFQPTRLLADRATRLLGSASTQLLLMRRHVPPLHTHGKATLAGRTALVDGAFGTATGVDLAGSTVAVIDDVSTTGATLAEASRTLKRAGAKRVVAVVLAKWTAVARERPAGVDPGSTAA